MSEQTDVPTEETVPSANPEAGVPVAGTAPAPPAGKRPRWQVALVAAFVALLLMGAGAHVAFGIARHIGGGDFRRGHAAMAPGHGGGRGGWQKAPCGGPQDGGRYDRGPAGRSGPGR